MPESSVTLYVVGAISLAVHDIKKEPVVIRDEVTPVTVAGSV